MDNDPYTLDSNGDVILLFYKSFHSQRVETSNQIIPSAGPTTSPPIDASAASPNASAVRTISPSVTLTNLQPIWELMDVSEEGQMGSDPVRIRVSSRHLALASPVFNSMFSGNWTEGYEIRYKGTTAIVMDMWDIDAILIVMNIIHGYAPRVPRKVDLDTLTKIAVIVDYYQCPGVVEIFADIWVDQLKGDIPKTFCKAVLQWICIAWVFRKPAEFLAATRVALVESSGVVQSYGLPIPHRVIEQINERRLEGIKEALSAMDRVIDDLSSSTHRCSFECSSILLGALIKFLRLSNLIFPDPAPPYNNLSIGSLTRSVMLFARSPLWESRMSTKGRPEWHSCRLGNLFDPIRHDLEDRMNGLKLEDFA